MATARINMQHGFMKSIIKNQVDRDNYDKEVKAKMESTPSNSKYRHPKHRPKKPDKQVYVPPFMKKENKEQLFVLEFEDRNGQIHTVDVYREDTAEHLAQELGCKCNLKTAYVSALSDRIQQEIDKRL
ncbi:UPF0561 protein C2orf68 homolog [Babylonia areolata]|uniref:UPF0561 protein C2orf68 homolog n=1 Tax=Babylonia areolata TaxID=304850 RepID=UPI003FD2338F